MGWGGPGWAGGGGLKKCWAGGAGEGAYVICWKKKNVSAAAAASI